VICQPCLSTDHDVIPTRVLPAIPTCATRIEWAPIVTLWAIWTRLSTLTPWFDDRLAECGSIDRDIRPELDVIFDRDSAELGNLVMSSLVLHIAESVASDHRATVNDHSALRSYSLPDDDVRIQERIVPDRCIVADKDTG